MELRNNPVMLGAATAAVFGYRRGRSPAPVAPHLDTRRQLLGVLAVALLAAVVIGAGVFVDGISFGKAIEGLAENIGMIALLALLPAYVGFLLGRLARDGHAPARA
jgi:hypothetical protein